MLTVRPGTEQLAHQRREHDVLFEQLEQARGARGDERVVLGREPARAADVERLALVVREARLQRGARRVDDRGDGIARRGARAVGVGHGEVGEAATAELAGEARARVGDVVVGDVVVEHDDVLFDRAVREHDDREHDARLQQHEIRGAHDDGLRLGADDDRGVRGDAGEQLARLRQQLVHGERGAAEELDDAAALGGRQLPGAGEVVDVVAVAPVGRDPARRGVRLGDVALPLEQRHLVAHGGRRNAETGRVGDGLRADRLRRVDVLLDDRAQHRRLAFVELGHALPLAAVSTQWYRVPACRATPDRRRGRAGEEQAGGQVGREEPAGAGEDDPVRRRRSRRPCVGEIADGRRRRRASATAPARVRSARENASSARVAGSRISEPRDRGRTGVDRGDVALGRADVPPPLPVGVAVRGAPDRRGTRRRSSTARCAGTPRRVGPSSTPRTTRARRRSSTVVGARVRVGLQIVVGRGRAGRDLAAERGRGLDRERVRADVLDAERERAVERSLPVVGRFAGRAVDEIDD